MFPPCTEAASQYVAMEREWDNGVRPVFIFRFCFILPEWPGTIFLPSQNFFFFMFQIMIIPTLEELLCNERTLYKRLVFSLLLLSHYPEAFSEDTEHCAHQALPLPKHLTFSHTALLFVPSTLIVHPPALPSHFCSCGHFPGTPFVLSPNLLNPHPLLKYSFMKSNPPTLPQSNLLQIPVVLNISVLCSELPYKIVLNFHPRF